MVQRAGAFKAKVVIECFLAKSKLPATFFHYLSCNKTTTALQETEPRTELKKLNIAWTLCISFSGALLCQRRVRVRPRAHTECADRLEILGYRNECTMTARLGGLAGGMCIVRGERWRWRLALRYEPDDPSSITAHDHRQ